MQILVTIALIVIGVFLFEFIIFFHELGHFITAKRSGVQVNEFAIGMGPKLFGFKKGETKYTLRLFPIGGYCAMEGEDETSDNPRAFTNAKLWKRMIIIVAGAAMNMILGFILVFVIVVQADVYDSVTISQFVPNSYTANSGLQTGDVFKSVNGYSVLNSRDLQFSIATLSCNPVDAHSVTVYKQDCAYETTSKYVELAKKYELDDAQTEEFYAILQAGCTEINKTESKSEAEAAMKSAVDGLYGYLEKIGKLKLSDTDIEYPEIKERDERKRFTADVTVLRDGSELQLEDVQFFTYYASEEDAEADKPTVAFDFYVEPIEKNFFTVIEQTVTQTISLAKTVWTSLIWLIQGKFSFNDLSGPVGITTAVSFAASQGLQVSFLQAVNNIITVMALITVNLGIVNMLPFPALDGGRFLFYIIEAIFRRPVPQKFERIVNTAGLVILLIFIAIVSIKDIWQLITGTMPGIS